MAHDESDRSVPAARHDLPYCTVEVLDVRQGIATIEVAGDLDRTTAPRLSDALVGLDVWCVHLDATELRFVDAGGLQALLDVEAAAGGPGHLVIHGARRAFNRILAICDLQRWTEPHEHHDDEHADRRGAR